MTFMITVGKYGGFYIVLKGEVRVCLGWIALTIFPFDAETRMFEILRNTGKILKE